MTPVPAWLRRALFATAGMNIVVSAAFIPAAAPLRALLGLPEGHPFYLATVGMFVATFGLAYLWAAVSGRPERLFIALAAVGKLSFFGLLVGFWAAGALPARAPVLGAADLLFATIFATWLLGSRAGA